MKPGAYRSGENGSRVPPIHCGGSRDGVKPFPYRRNKRKRAGLKTRPYRGSGGRDKARRLHRWKERV